MDIIRLVIKNDIEDLKRVLNSIELFPAEMLDDMMADYLNNPDSEDIWFTAVENGKAIAIGFCGPEKMTDGTFSLYAIGTRKDIQGKGIGSKMMTFIEKLLVEKGGRILIVDTSGKDEYLSTRKFYEKLDYNKEAVIRDFWEEGDDKVTFWKKLR